jgi:hypothetical protein
VVIPTGRPRRIRETYVSVDIEADGPIPGPNSMLSLGAAAFAVDGTHLATFSVNFQPLPGATPDPETMEWWRGFPEAWAAATRNQHNPLDAMTDFRHWVEALPGKPVMIAYPAGYDFLWTHWYLHRFTGGTPFSHSALDIKTVAMMLLNRGYRDATKRNWLPAWFAPDAPHTHHAADDALEQGRSFFAMLDDANLRRAERQRLLAVFADRELIA